MLHVIYDDYVLCQDPGDALPHQQCARGVPCGAFDSWPSHFHESGFFLDFEAVRN
jgi:hypothetical protein